VVIVKRELHQQKCTLYGAYCGDVVPRCPSALSRCLMHDTSPDKGIEAIGHGSPAKNCAFK
jgi:hypothetical protein